MFSIFSQNKRDAFPRLRGIVYKQFDSINVEKNITKKLSNIISIANHLISGL